MIGDPRVLRVDRDDRLTAPPMTLDRPAAQGFLTAVFLVVSDLVVSLLLFAALDVSSTAGVSGPGRPRGAGSPARTTRAPTDPGEPGSVPGPLAGPIATPDRGVGHAAVRLRP